MQLQYNCLPVSFLHPPFVRTKTVNRKCSQAEKIYHFVSKRGAATVFLMDAEMNMIKLTKQGQNISYWCSGKRPEDHHLNQ